MSIKLIIEKILGKDNGAVKPDTLSSAYPKINHNFENTKVFIDDTRADVDNHSQRITQVEAASKDGEVLAARGGYATLKDRLDAIQPGTKIGFTLSATEGQTVFTLPAATTYEPGQNRLEVFITGVRQHPGKNFTETSTTQFTLSEGLKADTQVDVVVQIGSFPITSGHGKQHTKLGSDPIHIKDLFGADDWGVNVEWFGPIGLGDDKTTLQTAIDFAEVNDIRKVVFPSHDYVVSDVLLVNSETLYEGLGGSGSVSITQKLANKPVMASKNFYGGSPTGGLKVKGFTLVGDPLKPNNHGLLVRDYYSTVEDVRTSNTGGDGVRFVHKDNAGNAVAGTLVENRIKDCSVYNPAGYGFYLGDADNNKLTDGFLEDCVVQASATSPGHVFIGSSAGWKVDGIHTYGSAPGTSISAQNGYHTKISNLYIEAFKDVAVNCAKGQSSLSIHNISVKCSSANVNAKVILLDKAGFIPEYGANVSGLQLIQDADVAVYGIYCNTSLVKVDVRGFQAFGAYKNRITKYSSPDLTQIKRLEDAVVDGSLRDSANKKTLRYQGYNLAQYATKFANGNAANSVSITLPPIQDFGKLVGTLTIDAMAFDNGAKRATWVSHLVISNKTVADTLKAYITDLVAASGFSVAPTITLDKATSIMTINFTFTDADARGVISFIYAASE